MLYKMLYKMFSTYMCTQGVANESREALQLYVPLDTLEQIGWNRAGQMVALEAQHL